MFDVVSVITLIFDFLHNSRQIQTAYQSPASDIALKGQVIADTPIVVDDLHLRGILLDIPVLPAGRVDAVDETVNAKVRIDFAQGFEIEPRREVLIGIGGNDLRNVFAVDGFGK